MSEKTTEKRGMWDGIPYELLKPGISCDNPDISPNGKYLSFTLNTDEKKIFTAKIQRKLNVSDINSYTTTGLSTGTPYGGKMLSWAHNSKELIYSSGGKLFSLNLDDDGSPNLLFDYPSQYAFAPAVSKNFYIFSIEKKQSMALGVIKHSKDINFQTLPIKQHFLYDPQINYSESFLLLHHWNFPNMSWNGSRISIFPLKDLLNDSQDQNSLMQYTIAGSDDIATSQPRFSPNGNYLTYMSEEKGWLNLWIANGDGTDARPLVEEDCEHAYSTWITGGSAYSWLPNSKDIIFCRNSHGFFSLVKVNVDNGEKIDLNLPIGAYSNIHASNNMSKPFVTALYSDHQTKNEIHLIDPYADIQNSIKSVVISSSPFIGEKRKKQMIKPEIVSFPTSDNSIAYGLLYLSPDGNGRRETAPVIIYVHGGPTGMITNSFFPTIQYLSSKGYAVFAVNYRGSIGYGRDYRNLLNKNWGVYDVNDCVDALNYLNKKGFGDNRRAAIMGGSAGGFTVLMTLIRYPGLFSAGIDLYGISDAFGIAEETHYLESRYSESLFGPLPESAKKYFERSAVFHAEKIQDPLIIFQGADDPVVAKNQSERIKAQVEGVCELNIYENEGHGFQKPETFEKMISSLDIFLKKYCLFGINKLK